MILLIFPTMATKTKNQKRWDPKFEECISKQEIKTCYWKIFKENNVQMRRLFFKQPLIQFLWTKFITESKGEIQCYFESLKEEEEKYSAMINDVQDLSDSVAY
jgi:hypothetical protein